MSRSPYVGSPEISAETQVPGDYQRVDANPAAFGAGLAQGGEAVGAGLMKASDFYGQVAATNGATNAARDVQTILHGDPSKMVPGPDGKPVPDTGFLGLNGADAMHAYQDVQSRIDEAVNDRRAELGTESAKLQYDEETRRWQAQWESEAGAHYDRQQRVWGIATNKDSIAVAQRDIGLHPEDPNVYADAQQRLRTAYVRNAQLATGDASLVPDDPSVAGMNANAATLAADKAAARTQVFALMQSNPVAAVKALQDHEDVLAGDPSTYALSREAEGRAADFLTGKFSDPTAVAAARASGNVGAAAPGATQVDVYQTLPVSNYHISATGGGFGERASKPTPGASQFHMGVDLAVPNGTQVVADGDGGTVVSAGPMKGFGNAVVIRHADGTVSLLGDLGPVSVQAGQQVQGGSPVAQVGPNANETGPHVHYGRFTAEGHPINPLTGQVLTNMVGGPLHAEQAGAAPGAGSASYLATIHGHESGGSPIATNPASSATGIDQVLGNTWYNPAAPSTSIMGQPEFAQDIAGKTPAQIAAMRTDPAVSDRATLVYAQMNGRQLQAWGDPVNAATLGLAHGFGATGADRLLKADPSAPLSQIDPMAAKSNPNMANTPVGQIVQNFTQRFGTGAVDYATGAINGGAGAPAGGDDAYLASVRQAVQAILPKSPDLVENVVKRVEFNIRRDDGAQVANVETSVKNAASYLADGGDPSKVSITPAQVRASVPGPRGEQLATDLQDATQYGAAVKQVATAPENQLDGIVAAHAPSGPDDYGNRASTYAALQKAVSERRRMIYGDGKISGDAAGYVSSAFPDVAQALARASGPRSTPQDFTAYVGRLRATYDALGIDASYRTILPRPLAQGIVGGLEKSLPGPALGTLQNLSRETGPSWPQVYGDLVRAGLPDGFQAPLVVSGVSPQNAQVMVSAMQHDAELKGAGKDDMATAAKGLNFRGKSVSELVDRTLSTDADLSSLRATFGVAGRAGVDRFTGVENAVRTTALYLYLSGSATDPAQAAQRAAGFVTGMYDFVQQPGHPPARLPRGMAPDFHVAASAALDSLKPGDVRPYQQESTQVGNLVTVAPAELAEHALAGAKRAFWVTVPDEGGAVRAIDPVSGRPVILNNGRPLDLSFANLRARAARARAAQPTMLDRLGDTLEALSN